MNPQAQDFHLLRHPASLVTMFGHPGVFSIYRYILNQFGTNHYQFTVGGHPAVHVRSRRHCQAPMLTEAKIGL
jgi:hypothetical protein